tara:strand:+ start:740 stop:1216 length:477 start_codon:yes stop_codon:yes gene_type:complete
MKLKNNRFICQTILIINLLFCSSIIFAQEGTEILNGFSMKHDVYKILTLEEWNTAKKNGKVITELDQNDGFVHLSTSNQLGLTLSLYFKDHKNVVLLQINTQMLKDKLIFEEPISKNDRTGLFPHIYGELSTEHITKSWFLERGAFALPDEVLAQSES